MIEEANRGARDLLFLTPDPSSLPPVPLTGKFLTSSSWSINVCSVPVPVSQAENRRVCLELRIITGTHP